MKLLKKIKKVYIASDHAGYPLKEVIIKEFLSKESINFQDLGTNSEKSVDYPKFAKKLCKKINKTSMGILICGSGIGVSISANRHNHIRASLCHNVNSAKMTRKHNDSNVICLQGRPFVKKKIFAMLNAYFDTEFEEGRHKRRVEQL
ncbi:ribose 5-phosphate isomerase B [Alphaproteobacteria bacterium]|nr:ribose 5-phosphate isomerase B [Alphaproteobacteria bacterium]